MSAFRVLCLDGGGIMGAFTASGASEGPAELIGLPTHASIRSRRGSVPAVMAPNLM